MQIPKVLREQQAQSRACIGVLQMLYQRNSSLIPGLVAWVSVGQVLGGQETAGLVLLEQQLRGEQLTEVWLQKSSRLKPLPQGNAMAHGKVISVGGALAAMLLIFYLGNSWPRYGYKKLEAEASPTEAA